jgi:putative peptidoglycan lipid II flippase
MLSRVLGLLRDIVLAKYIGTGVNADPFYIAFKIPNFLRRLFAEGAFAQAFVPVLAEYKNKGSHAAVQALINRVCGCLGASVLAVTAFALIATPAVTTIFAIGYWNKPHEFELTTQFLRITFPYLFLISMTGFAGAILNSYGRFAIPAFTPVLLNITLITAAVVVSPHFDPPAVAMAWGVLVSGAVQLVFQLPFLMKLQLMPTPVMDWKDPGVKKILTLMLPAMFGVSVSQINLLLDTSLATMLVAGSPSWLFYSDRMAELPLGVFGIAIATVILPSLSREFVSANNQRFSETLSWAMRCVFVIGVPAAAALMVLAEPILLTLFQSGKWTLLDTQMSAMSLRAYAFGTVAFMLIKILAPGFFARQDTKTPVKIGVIAMVANMVLNIALVLPLMRFDIGHVGLALATSLAAILNAYLLFRGLSKQGVYRHQPGWGKFWLRLLFASGAMAGVLLWASLDWLQWQEQAVWVRYLRLGLICGVGFAIFIAGLWLSGMRPRDFRPPR